MVSSRGAEPSPADPTIPFLLPREPGCSPQHPSRTRARARGCGTALGVRGPHVSSTTTAPVPQLQSRKRPTFRPLSSTERQSRALPKPSPLPCAFFGEYGPPLQATAAVRPEQWVRRREGAGEPDTKSGRSPARQDPTPFPRRLLVTTHPPVPVPAQPPACRRARRKSRHRFPCAGVETAAAAPSSAHAPLPKKAGPAARDLRQHLGNAGSGGAPGQLPAPG